MPNEDNSSATPIVIGIAGHRYIEAKADSPTLKKMQDGLRVVFRAFSAESLSEDSGDAEQKRAWQLRKDLGFPPEMLAKGLPKHNPVWLLSPMAEGSDTLAAVEAYRFYRGKTGPCEASLAGEHGTRRRFKIVAPLAKPLDFAREEDTEGDPVWGDYAWPQGGAPLPGVQDDEEPIASTLEAIRGALPADEPANSDEYDEFVLPLGGRGILRHHTSYLAEDFPEWVIDAFKEGPKGRTESEAREAAKSAFPNGPLGWHIKPSNDGVALFTDNRARQHYRTGATYVALYCDAVVAIWDGKFLPNSVGTDAAVRMKLAGPEPGLTSHSPIFHWADAGPVVQILAENNNPNQEPPSGGDAQSNTGGGKYRDKRFDDLAQQALKIGDDEIGEILVLHPADCVPGRTPDEDRLLREEHGTGIFSHILEATNRFNLDV